MLTGILLFLVGVCLLGWHRSHERYRDLRRTSNEVVRQNARLIHYMQQAGAAIRSEKTPPAPQHWGDQSYDRLAADLGIRLVDVESGREAHSHATKTATTLPPEESA